MFIDIPTSKHLHTSGLLADAALITGEKKKEVAGCSNDEAKEVAMVAAEKSPRPIAAGWMASDTAVGPESLFKLVHSFAFPRGGYLKHVKSRD